MRDELTKEQVPISTGVNNTDTVSSTNETAKESGNDTDPTSNDSGTVEKDGKDVANVNATGTVVSGDDESAEESGNDTDPASDDNGIRTSMLQIRML